MKRWENTSTIKEQEVNNLVFWASVIAAVAGYCVVMFFMDGVWEDAIVGIVILGCIVVKLFEKKLGSYAKYFYISCAPIGAVITIIVDHEGRYMAACQCYFVWIILAAAYGQIKVVKCCAIVTIVSNFLGILFFQEAFFNLIVMIGWWYCLIIYTISVVIAILLAKRAQDWTAMEKKMQVYEQETIYFKKLQKKEEINSRFIHDIGHYLKAIAELVRIEEYSGITDILKELDIVIEENTFVIYTKHRMLNAILLAKSREAEEKGIKMDILVEPNVTLNKISDSDLVIILGNLLENAIYAVSQKQESSEDKQIVVRIYMNESGRTSVIKIQNTYQKIILKNEKGYLSEKRNYKENGIGLKSVEMTTQKYGGYLECNVQENLFCALVILPIQK